MKRADVILLLIAAPALAGAASPVSGVTVYRDVGCECCEGWAAALAGAGYRIDIRDVEHVERLRQFRIPPALAGCHTAVAGRYLIEGHVPLEAIDKLLRQRPATRGIALPGMPLGTPGMPGPKSPVRVVYLDDPSRTFYAS